MKLRLFQSRCLKIKNIRKLSIPIFNSYQREIILQTANSNKLKPTGEPNVELVELTKILIQKQTELNRFCDVAYQQQILHEKIQKVKNSLSTTETNVKCLITYLKETESIVSSAVYESKLKLDMIKKSKAIPSEELVRYAHKISSDNGVCCPENWNIDNPKRPYPTDADMRKGWLAKLQEKNANFDEDPIELSPKPAQQESLARSNSTVINPIVQTDFLMSTTTTTTSFAAAADEYMSDKSNDASSDDSSESD
jgi:hypothetical protein